MTNLQAAVGCAQLEQVDRFVSRKLEMAARTPRVGRAPIAVTVQSTVGAELDLDVRRRPSRFRPVRCRRVREAPRRRRLQTRPFFLGMHEQPVYRRMGLFSDARCPVTEQVSRRGLYLPSGQAITDGQIDAVIRSVRKVLS